MMVIPEILATQGPKCQYFMKERQLMSHYSCRVDTIIFQSRQASEMWGHILHEEVLYKSMHLSQGKEACSVYIYIYRNLGSS